MQRPLSVLKDSWGLFNAYPSLFIGIYIIPVLLGIIVMFLALLTPEEMTPQAGALLVVSIIPLIVANILAAIALVIAVQNPTGETITSAYSKSTRFALQYIWAAIIATVFVLIGFILFIIPGIIISIYLSMTYYAVVCEKKSGFEAVKTSYRYVKGHWWAIFFRILVLTFVFILIGIPLAIAGEMLGPTFVDIIDGIVVPLLNVIFAPLATIYFYKIYQELKLKHETVHVDLNKD